MITVEQFCKKKPKKPHFLKLGTDTRLAKNVRKTRRPRREYDVFFGDGNHSIAFEGGQELHPEHVPVTLFQIVLAGEPPLSKQLVRWRSDVGNQTIAQIMQVLDRHKLDAEQVAADERLVQRETPDGVEYLLDGVVILRRVFKLGKQSVSVRFTKPRK